ncbi:tripartite tricarboxylate transporter permease, partial [Azospirillum brasilense]|uniref:tripartite tricarboxylate transporter permease n=1 Tax=Azospirillum brasilense TaxID=192 RepID=UPI001FFF345A
MTDLIGNLLLGLTVSLSPDNLLLCFGGALIGTLIGVLPGLGPTATVAMLLPLTFHLPPVGALIMLAGIFYGSQYGGSATAILVNLPGESSSVVTCLDGHAMARQGRAGVGVATAARAPRLAGRVTTFLIPVAGAAPAGGGRGEPAAQPPRAAGQRGVGPGPRPSPLGLGPGGVGEPAVQGRRARRIGDDRSRADRLGEAG